MWYNRKFGERFNWWFSGRTSHCQITCKNLPIIISSILPATCIHNYGTGLFGCVLATTFMCHVLSLSLSLSLNLIPSSPIQCTCTCMAISVHVTIIIWQTTASLTCLLHVSLQLLRVSNHSVSYLVYSSYRSLSSCVLWPPLAKSATT